MESLRPASASSGFGILSLLDKSQKPCSLPPAAVPSRHRRCSFELSAYSSDRRKKTSLVAIAATAAEIR